MSDYFSIFHEAGPNIQLGIRRNEQLTKKILIEDIVNEVNIKIEIDFKTRVINLVYREEKEMSGE